MTWWRLILNKMAIAREIAQLELDPIELALHMSAADMDCAAEQIWAERENLA